jgi:ankyrin repeat protein
MGRRKLTKILLESGCNPTLKNMQGETAMDIALRKSLKEVQEIIANPPPLRDTRSSSKTRLTTGKKREKESSLEGSKGSEGNHKSRKDRSQQKKVKDDDAVKKFLLSVCFSLSVCVSLSLSLSLFQTRAL